MFIRKVKNNVPRLQNGKVYYERWKSSNLVTPVRNGIEPNLNFIYIYASFLWMGGMGSFKSHWIFLVWDRLYTHSCVSSGGVCFLSPVLRIANETSTWHNLPHWLPDIIRYIGVLDSCSISRACFFKYVDFYFKQYTRVGASMQFG